MPRRECKIFEHLGKTGVCSDIHGLGHTKVASRGDLTGIREKNGKDLGCLLRVSTSNLRSQWFSEIRKSDDKAPLCTSQSSRTYDSILYLYQQAVIIIAIS